MQFRVLGCSGGLGTGGHTTTFALGRRVLIDAGTGVGRLSLDDMQALEHVFLTHAHLDHIAGLAFLADTRFAHGATGLRVHARASVLGALRAHIFNWQIWPDFASLGCEHKATIETRRVHMGKAVAIDDAVLTPLPARHTVPACGYAVECAGGTLVYSGDTTACGPFWRALNKLDRLDHLIIEVAYSDEQERLGRVARHYTPAVLGQELRKLRHRPVIHITHHKPGRGALIEAQCAEALAGWEFRHLQMDDVIDL